MSERRLIGPGRALLLATALCFGLVGAVAPADRALAATARPNIVVIMTDDQRLDELYAGLGGGELMPRTRRLIGDAGVTFDRSYVSYSLSCPSRTTFLTGRYAHNHGITANVLPNEGQFDDSLPDEISCGIPGVFPARDSLAPWLQAAGYYTIIAGRYLNRYPYPYTLSRTLRDPGWSRWFVPVTVGDDVAADYYQYYLNEDGRLLAPAPEGLFEDSVYFTNVITDRASAAIERAPADQPIFLFLSHRAPHEDVDELEGPAPAHRHALFLESLEQSLLPSYDEPDISDKPPFFQRRQDRLAFGERRQIHLRAIRRQASLRAVDESTAEIAEALRRTGRLENTYFFFTSDNGFLLGEHRLPKGKIRPYEPSTRVPLMVAGPGVPAGEVSEELVSNVDLAPTILELAGATATTPLDGRSLVPYLRDPDARSGRPLLIESFRDDSSDSLGTSNPRVQAAPFESIVLGRYKLVLHDDKGAELYDLERDPYELHNAFDKPAYAEARRYLERELRRLRRCIADGCRAEIPPAPGPS